MKRRILLAAALLVGGRVAHAATCSPTTFITAATYAVQPAPDEIVVADFNGDGDQDIATLSQAYSTSTVAVFLGNSDGTFQFPITTPGPDQASSLAAGTFHGGSVVDLVIGRYDGTVATLRGNGDGTFQPAIISAPAAPTSMTALAAAYLDGDGNLDLVATGSNFNAVVLLGNGDGTFKPPVVYPTSTSVSSLAIGDLDGDGAQDLAMVGGGNAIVLLFGAGNGTFGFPTLVPAGPNLQDIHLADLNLDGHLDIATLANNEYVAVLLGEGDGTFHAPHNYSAGAAPRAVGVGDFDNDGHPDLAAASADSYGATQLWLLYGNGDGSFRSGPGYVASGNFNALAIADFGNAPGADAALLTGTDRALSILTGNGDGSLQAVRVQSVAAPPFRLVSGDFNGDGLPDLAAGAMNYSSSVQILMADPAGGFYPLAAISPPEPLTALGAGEFTGDGLVDLIGSGYQTVYLFAGNGDGTFQSPTSIPVDGYGGTTLTVADFNADGRLDFAVTPNGGSLGSQFAVFRGNGDGTFQSPIASPLVTSPTAVLAADFSGNGRVDLALIGTACCGPYNTVSVLIGNGDGSFGPGVDYETGSQPTSLATAAFGFGSSNLDLVVANSADATFSLLRGNGDGTFQNQILIGLPWNPEAIVAADFDGDGLADVATANSQGTGANVLRGLGGGKFRSPEVYPVGAYPGPMLVIDVAGNGTPDIVVGTTQNLFGIAQLLNARLAAAPLLPAGTCEGSGANIRVHAGGFGHVTYQWRRNGVPLTDGDPYGGVTTPVLIISPATAAEAGDYDVVLGDACTSTTSTTTTFTVDARPPQPTVVIAPSLPPGTAGLTAAVANPTPGHTYFWSLTGAVISGGQGTDTVTFATLLPGELTISVTDYAVPGCGNDSAPLAIPVDYLDVPPSNPFHNDVVTVARAGITAGCGGGDYCPTAPVTRAQMAVFLLKAKYGAAHVPPPSSQLFDDVPPGSFAYNWINELASFGITTGCGGADYCPGSSVTRAQMAVFLLKTLIGSYYDPPFGPQIFDDVPQYGFAANYIGDLYGRGITGGCSLAPLLYCPDSPVNRGQMATFLVRTFLTP